MMRVEVKFLPVAKCSPGRAERTGLPFIARLQWVLNNKSYYKAECFKDSATFILAAVKLVDHAADHIKKRVGADVTVHMPVEVFEYTMESKYEKVLEVQ